MGHRGHLPEPPCLTGTGTGTRREVICLVLQSLHFRSAGASLLLFAQAPPHEAFLFPALLSL